MGYKLISKSGEELNPKIRELGEQGASSVFDNGER